MKLTKKTRADYLLFSAIIFGGILVDQITKLIASTYLKNIATLPIIEGFLHFTYTENTGAAFGMLKEHRWVFILISTLTIIGLTLYLYLIKSEGRLYDVSISIIISGGIANMLDRIGIGYVVDFIDFRVINFAVFNIADSFVCVGSGLLMIALVRTLIKEAQAEKEKKAAQAASGNVDAENTIADETKSVTRSGIDAAEDTKDADALIKDTVEDMKGIATAVRDTVDSAEDHVRADICTNDPVEENKKQ